MVIYTPSITPKLSTQEHICEGKDYQKDHKIKNFAHDKLPKVWVVVMHHGLEKKNSDGFGYYPKNLEENPQIFLEIIDYDVNYDIPK